MNDRSTLQTLTLLFGIVFLAVGILGFIPGITTHYGDLSFAGDNSDSKLLGIFQVSVLHNIIHLLFGVAGLWAARTFDSSRIYMIGGGIIYLALFVIGLFDGLNWVPANNADDWLHLGLGVAMVGIGYVLGKEQVSRTAAA
jgi:hypothetical protein